MTNHEYTQGPATPDGPTVDEIRAQMGGGRFNNGHFRSVVVSAITDSRETRQGDGTVTDAEMDQLRRMATARGRRELPDEKSYIERRDPVSGVAIRTYEGGRTEEMDH